MSRRAAAILIAGALFAGLAGCGPGPIESAPERSVWPEPSWTAPATSLPSHEPAGDAARQGSTAPPVGRSVATIPPAREVDAPVAVNLPGVDIDASVVPVGVEADGQMELPPDPDVVGWYRHGPAAGDDAGSVVLAGHVDSRTYGEGQLARLRNSSVDDVVVVTTESGLDRRYRVVDVRHIPQTQLPVAELFSRDGDEQLVVITCGGAYDPEAGYEDNVIVTAVPE